MRLIFLLVWAMSLYRHPIEPMAFPCSPTAVKVGIAVPPLALSEKGLW